MVRLDERKVRTYLEARFGGSARIVGTSVLGREPGATDLKGYGDGVPLRIVRELSRLKAYVGFARFTVIFIPGTLIVSGHSERPEAAAQAIMQVLEDKEYVRRPPVVATP